MCRSGPNAVAPAADDPSQRLAHAMVVVVDMSAPGMLEAYAHEDATDYAKIEGLPYDEILRSMLTEMTRCVRDSLLHRAGRELAIHASLLDAQTLVQECYFELLEAFRSVDVLPEVRPEIAHLVEEARSMIEDLVALVWVPKGPS